MKRFRHPTAGKLFVQIAENWNGQVTNLFNRIIMLTQHVADKSSVKAIRKDYDLPSVNPGHPHGWTNRMKSEHERPDERQVFRDEALTSFEVDAGTIQTPQDPV